MPEFDKEHFRLAYWEPRREFGGPAEIAIGDTVRLNDGRVGMVTSRILGNGIDIIDGRMVVVDDLTTGLSKALFVPITEPLERLEPEPIIRTELPDWPENDSDVTIEAEWVERLARATERIANNLDALTAFLERMEAKDLAETTRYEAERVAKEGEAK